MTKSYMPKSKNQEHITPDNKRKDVIFDSDGKPKLKHE
jgi:hypothetical protein